VPLFSFLSSLVNKMKSTIAISRFSSCFIFISHTRTGSLLRPFGRGHFRFDKRPSIWRP
jgi:hypothetical protein